MIVIAAGTLLGPSEVHDYPGTAGTRGDQRWRGRTRRKRGRVSPAAGPRIGEQRHQARNTTAQRAWTSCRAGQPAKASGRSWNGNIPADCPGDAMATPHVAGAARGDPPSVPGLTPPSGQGNTLNRRRPRPGQADRTRRVAAARCGPASTPSRCTRPRTLNSILPPSRTPGSKPAARLSSTHNDTGARHHVLIRAQVCPERTVGRRRRGCSRSASPSVTRARTRIRVGDRVGEPDAGPRDR